MLPTGAIYIYIYQGHKATIKERGAVKGFEKFVYKYEVIVSESTKRFLLTFDRLVMINYLF